MIDHENLVTISCFRTFLTFNPPTCSIFAFTLNTFFFILFHKTFSTGVYTGGRGGH